WSSDVCSSDLHPNTRKTARVGGPGLCRAVPLRMTGIGSFVAAVCCCLVRALSGLLRAATVYEEESSSRQPRPQTVSQSTQETKPSTTPKEPGSQSAT